MKRLGLLLAALTFTGLALACSEDGTGGFLPENKLRIPVNVKMDGTLTQLQFNAVIKKVETIYAPVVSSMGAKLKVIRKWTDPTVNAYADRRGAPGVWNVTMFGGLARHPSITEDGFALVICHELGHHIGGAPKKTTNLWSSVEGESDYFAALKCLRHVFLNDNNDAVLRKMKLDTVIPDALNKACKKEWSNKADRDICIRTGMAGASVAGMFEALNQSPPPKFDTPDKSVIKATYELHPDTQCRLDTFFQGALCEKSMNEDVSQTDEIRGACNRKTGEKIGLRPLCWFKPKA
jgi:hypothetical protein